MTLTLHLSFSYDPVES